MNSLQVARIVTVILLVPISRGAASEGGLSIPLDIFEDAILPTVGLISKYGYPEETHNITTQDGYLLELHRIPNKGKQPVLLQHGFLDSSATFVLMGPQKGLAYLLSDEGYDVWLGNSRGNRYCRGHTKLSPAEEAFWKFSWHEMGVFDLPAGIDYILEKTNFSQLHFIGHSQGSTAFFVMGSERPNYNSKVLLMQALAPVAYLTHSKTPFRRILGLMDTIRLASSTLGIHEFLPSSKTLASLGQTACRDNSQTLKYCSNILFTIAGYNEDQMNMTMLPVIYGHVPAGGSMQQLIHYGQIMKSEKFRKFDYGSMANLLRYRSFEPPSYNLTKVTAPIILHYSKNDFFSAPEDVESLAAKLPHVISKRAVPMEKFNHIDFIWGTDVKKLLYNDLITYMKRFEEIRRS